jgi:protein gp37
MARRLKGMGKKKYENGFSLTLHPETLNDPLKWKTPHSIFVCSMSDIFHKDVPFSFVDKVITTIRNSQHHNYQMLTKRIDRMSSYFSERPVPDNLWLGATVESHLEVSRIDKLKRLLTPIRFLSCEPLLDDLGKIDLSGIDWVIVGGESGVKARPMKAQWLRSLLRQARKYEVPFYFKQWGTWGEDGIRRSMKKNGKSLDGKIIQMLPRPKMSRLA